MNMNIFEELDLLINNANSVNESSQQSGDGYASVEVNPNYSTAEQARSIIRKKFWDKITQDMERSGHGHDNSGNDGGQTPPRQPIDGGDDDDIPPASHIDIDDSSLPDPFEPTGGRGGEQGGQSVSDETLAWDDDDYEQIESQNEEENNENNENDENDNFDEQDNNNHGRGRNNESEPPVESEEQDDTDDQDDQDDDDNQSTERHGQTTESGDDDQDDQDDDDNQSTERHGITTERHGDDDQDNQDDDDNQSTERHGITTERHGDDDQEGSDDGTTERHGITTERHGDDDQDNQDDDDNQSTERHGQTTDNTVDDDSNQRDAPNHEAERFHQDFDGKTIDQSLRDALNRVSDETDDKNAKKKIQDLLDNLQKDNGKSDSEKLNDSVDEYKDNSSNADEMVGQMVDPMTDEELRDELKKHGYDEKDIQENIDKKNENVTPTDSETEQMRKRAIDELNDKCGGKSNLSDAILYHSLKTAKLDTESWEKLLEKILKEKSKSRGEFKQRRTISSWGDQKHLWRGAILPRVKTQTDRGGDTYKLCCFVDWHQLLKSQPEFIYTFLAKILEFTNNLLFTDIDVYGFANHVSLPRTINKELVEKDGIKKAMSDTFQFIDKQKIGSSNENFKEIAEEINRVKREVDEHAIFLIFGDGIWSFYGNQYPPIHLKKICPNYLDDIITFVFMYPRHRNDSSLHQQYMKEIACLKDYVGLKNLIVTDADFINKNFRE